MLLVVGSPSLRRTALDQLAAARFAGLRRRPRDVRPGAPAAQPPPPRDPRGGGLARPAPVLGRQLPRRRRPDRRRRGRPARRARRAAGRRPRARSRPMRPTRARLTLRYVTNAPALRGEIAAGRPRPAPRRDRREGGLERRDAHRPASRRPGVRPRPAATWRGSPRAASSGRRSWRFKLAELDLLTAARRPAAPAPARRRLQRARPRAAGPPRPADRRSCRRPSSRRRPSTTSIPALRAVATSWEVRAGRSAGPPDRDAARVPARDLASPADDAHRRPHPGRRAAARARGRAPAGPGHRDVRGVRRRARAGGRGVLPGDPDRRLLGRRRGRCADRRPGVAAALERAARGVHGDARRGRRARPASPRPTWGARV